MTAADSSIPLPLSPAARPVFNPWVIALTVTMATFMEVLDTSIANVALPHIAGTLAVSPNESTWVLTSYLVANAVVLPLSGWLSSVFGRKRYYMTCVLLFTISSALCGMATSLSQLVFFRVLQGMGGGGLQPSEQAILVDTFPPAKRGMAMAIYTIAILVAPVLGPTLGGWITDNYSWRWIFYINLPVGILSMCLSGIVLQDPPHLVAQRKANKGKFRMDYIGLGLLGTLEVVLDKGQDDDWFGSRFILILSVIAAFCLITVIFWELRHPQPIVNLRLFANRNFGLCAVVIFFAFSTLYASTVLLPQMMQTLMGYAATQAGMVLSPAGLATMVEMPIIGILLGRRLDPRLLIAGGLLIVATAGFWMSTLSLQMAPSNMIWARVVQVLGAGMMFVPLNTVAYRFMPRNQVNNATGLYALVRNEGSSIGVALVTTLLQRHTQVHQAYLIERINPLNNQAMDFIHRAGAAVQSSDAMAATQQGLKTVYQLVQQQAALLSYMDMFRLFGVLAICVLPLVLLMKRSTPDKPGESVPVH